MKIRSNVKTYEMHADNTKFNDNIGWNATNFKLKHAELLTHIKPNRTNHKVIIIMIVFCVLFEILKLKKKTTSNVIKILSQLN